MICPCLKSHRPLNIASSLFVCWNVDMRHVDIITSSDYPNSDKKTTYIHESPNSQLWFILSDRSPPSLSASDCFWWLVVSITVAALKVSSLDIKPHGGLLSVHTDIHMNLVILFWCMFSSSECCFHVCFMCEEASVIQEIILRCMKAKQKNLILFFCSSTQLMLSFFFLYEMWVICLNNS